MEKVSSYVFCPLSIALAPRSKTRETDKETSTPVKSSSHYGTNVNNVATAHQDSIIQLQLTIVNQALQILMHSNVWTI